MTGRGEIPFYVPPPWQDDLSKTEEPIANDLDVNEAVESTLTKHLLPLMYQFKGNHIPRMS
jgi:hypothetical protein